MGNRINRIESEFVLNGVIDDDIRLQIHSEAGESEARLLEYDEKLMKVELLSESLLADAEEVRVFFFHLNNMHAFDTTVRFLEQDSNLYLTTPAGIYKNLQRKHERIRPPDGITVSFILRGKMVDLAFPKTNSYLEVEEPTVSEVYNTDKINSLLGDFRKDMSGKVSENRIVMLRNRVPSGFEEELLLKTSKIFWIPSTQLGFPLKDTGIESPVLTKQDLLHIEEESGIPNSVLKSRLDNYLFEKSKNDVFSAMYCPILYKQFLIGYIHLWNTMDRKEKIGGDLLDNAYQFAQVLCYALQQSGYFETEESADIQYDARIIDISASGLLFAHAQKDLSGDMLVHADLNLQLLAGERRIEIGARIIRKLVDRDHLYIALQFLDIYPEDYRFLYEKLYGKPYEEEYDDSWEGGIPPPKLKLD